MTGTDRLLELVVLIAAVVFLVPLVLMAWMMPMAGGHMWNGAVGWQWAIGWGLSLLVVLAIGYAVYRVIAGDRRRTDPAIEELRMSYARGDLSEEEFEERRERLEQGDRDR